MIKWVKGLINAYNEKGLITREQRKYLRETKPNHTKDSLTHPMMNSFNNEEQKRLKNILWFEFNLYWDIPNITKEVFEKRYLELCKLVPVDYPLGFNSLETKATAFYGEISKCYNTNYTTDDLTMLINKLRSVNDTKPRDYNKMLRVISALNKVTNELNKAHK
jgi:hypothetical protein